MKKAIKSGKARSQNATKAKYPDIQKILATTDFSAESLAGLRCAVALGRKLGLAVELLYVIEPRATTSALELVTSANDYAKLNKLAHTRLAKLAKSESKPPTGIKCLVRMGRPFHEITVAAREQQAELLVIATHGYTGAERVLLGSTAERVVRHAPCPVLTVPIRPTDKQIGRAKPFHPKKILVPIDFSKISEDALPWATFLAAHFGAEIILFHVVEKYPLDYLLGAELTNHTVTPLMEQAKENLEQMSGRLSKTTGLTVSGKVGTGKPYKEICQRAKRLGADLIVLTTHGFTGLKHVWLGSTAERVVRHADCPVLTVRELKRNML